MSSCLVCGTKTTRVAKETAGRYTLCNECVEKHYHIKKSYNIWCVYNPNNLNYLYSCHELLTKKEVISHEQVDKSQ